MTPIQRFATWLAAVTLVPPGRLNDAFVPIAPPQGVADKRWVCAAGWAGGVYAVVFTAPGGVEAGAGREFWARCGVKRLLEPVAVTASAGNVDISSQNKYYFHSVWQCSNAPRRLTRPDTQLLYKSARKLEIRRAWCNSFCALRARAAAPYQVVKK